MTGRSIWRLREVWACTRSRWRMWADCGRNCENWEWLLESEDRGAAVHSNFTAPFCRRQEWPWVRDYTLRGGRGNELPGLGAFDLVAGSTLIPRLRSLDQQSAMAFHSPPAWRLRTTRYLPRSSRRLPMAAGTSILQRPAS